MLAETRAEILDCETRLQRDHESLAALPGIEETLQRYRAAGVEEKLKSRDNVIRAQAVVRAAADTIEPFDGLAGSINALFPISVEFLSDDALTGLPAIEGLKSLRAVLSTFEARGNAAVASLEDARCAAHADITAVASLIASEQAATQTDYERVLRELQKERIDGTEFINLRQEMTRLAPLRERLARTQQRLQDVLQKRRNDLVRWEDAKRQRYQLLDRAARRVSRELPGRLRVAVTYAGNCEALCNLLKDQVGGRLSETFAILSTRADVSVTALADACRQGGDALAKEFGIPLTQAVRLAQAGSKLPMLIEELELPHVTNIELNIGPEKASPEWRKLDQLSTGQKATALLYLLMLNLEGPLVLDQPEDNLDNRFIAEGVVKKIRSEKRRRQFVFSTHNANIPVLGDAELIVAMRAVGEAGDGHVEIPPEHRGSIDKEPVAALVEEILEGGKDAFHTRRLKYGF